MEGWPVKIISSLRIIELVLTLVIMGLLVDVTCIGCFRGHVIKNQIIDGTVAASVPIHIALALTHYRGRDLTWFTLVSVSSIVGVFWLVSGSFISEFLYNYGKILHDARLYKRLIAAAVLSMFQFCFHILETVLLVMHR